ncbi:hypothetical protein AVEN_191039-1 [Araneus ventricosus]|uniref:Uncharacterized protein n=1 Tax=Araneus ventricosus TaxID=182803 RepID=A0A4Y2AZR0_ARAVE|nr:hypothetical protein AVEN_191039-1 [Araneus ventricosus]
MVVEAFRPSVYQFIKTGMEEIRLQVVDPLSYDLLAFGIGFEMATCWMLLQQSEEMKITWSEIPSIGKVLQCICGGRVRQFCTHVSLPVLSTSDFNLFVLLKKHLAGHRFRTNAEVQEAVVKWLCDLDPYFFYGGFDKLVHRCPKYFNNQGDYVEK